MAKRKSLFGRIYWPSLLAVLTAFAVGALFFIFIIGGIIGYATVSGTSKTQVKDNSILHMKLDGPIAERSHSEFDPMRFKVNVSPGLIDILYGLEVAKEDDKIKGVFLELGNVSCGYATAKELRDAIKDFQRSGKFVLAYNSGEYVGLGKYYISSSAKEVYGFPTSTMNFLGLGSQLTFYKGALDKLGVEMQIVRGSNNDFKSAVEPFFLEKMSDSSRLQMQTYVDNIWKSMRNDIAADRNISSNDLYKWADEMRIKRVKDAVEYKLMDGNKYRDEILAMLQKKVGAKSVDDLNLVSFEKYARSQFKVDQILNEKSKPNLAVIIAEGDIAVDGNGISSRKLCALIKEARENETIKTVVLRVNSPGGSALASDEIWREIVLTNQTKKVIVSMGDVAASGGYYIASPAVRIFAEENTITGSIGVFGMVPYTGKLMQDKLGLTFDEIKTNKHAVLSPNRKMTEEEYKTVQAEVDDIYDDFLSRVSEGRKMTKAQVNVIARGRVWTGTDAVRIGLVDEIGGLKSAIAYAAKQAGIKDVKVLYYPLVEQDGFSSVLETIGDTEAKINIQTQIPVELKTALDEWNNVRSISGIQMRLPFMLEPLR